MRLKNRTVVIIIAEGYTEHEYWFPYYRFKEEGANVITAGPETGVVLGEGRHGKDGLPATITHTIEQAASLKVDAIYLTGGIYGPLELRYHTPTLDFVRDAMEKNIIVAAICHSPWILVSADVLKGRRVSCPPDMAIDVINAGAEFVEEKCVRDGNLITAEYYACLPEHFRVLIPAIEES